MKKTHSMITVALFVALVTLSMAIVWAEPAGMKHAVSV